MNLFRSEEHIRRWAQLNPESANETIPLPDLAALMGTESRRHMLEPDYLSRWFPRRRQERQEMLERIGLTSSFWQG